MESCIRPSAKFPDQLIVIIAFSKINVEAFGSADFLGFQTQRIILPICFSESSVRIDVPPSRSSSVSDSSADVPFNSFISPVSLLTSYMSQNGRNNGLSRAQTFR